MTGTAFAILAIVSGRRVPEECLNDMKVCMEANDNLWRNQGIGEQARNLFETRCPEGFPFERPMSVFNFDRKYKSFLLRSIGGR